MLLSKKFKEGISGLGVVEVILILLVVVGLVLIFKSQITTIINTLFKSIKTQIKSV
ncbi:Flp1 family type IVb pilin [Lachnospiraceae bacterium 48-33]